MNDTFIYMRKKIGILSMLVLGILCIGYGSVEIFTHSSTLSLATHSDRNALMAAAANSTEAENDQLIIEPNDGTKTVLSLINSASQSIDLVIYELSDPDIEDALSAASKRGVTVRVLLNQIRTRMHTIICSRMAWKFIGPHLHLPLPIRNHLA
jgi:hypothetical protein